jgi:hypothetical protein
MTGVASTCTRPLPTRGAVCSSRTTRSEVPFKPGFSFSVELIGFSGRHNNAGMPKTPGTWDYVIVGAGTAGRLLAERGSDMIREDRKRLP